MKHLIEGLYVIPGTTGEKPYLIGSKCTACGELFFPKKEKGFCTHCQRKALQNVKLGREGVIQGFTVVSQPPAGGFYKGQVPYAYGFVDLFDGVRVWTQFAGNFAALETGKKAELVIEQICKDEKGDEVFTYMFKPC